MFRRISKAQVNICETARATHQAYFTEMTQIKMLLIQQAFILQCEAKTACKVKKKIILCIKNNIST